ncbi:MAG: RpiB/LacA/LacB family sugar-phosphate isomerase, partial [Micrococcales bacterium]
MKIAMASDHAGLSMKLEIRELLEQMGHQVVDFGTDTTDAADLPDYVYPAALAVSKGECDRG